MPKKSNLWPSTPRKETVERSGSVRFASPPPSGAALARAEAVLNSVTTAAATKAFTNLNFSVNRPHKDQALASQVLINNPPFNCRPPVRRCRLKIGSQRNESPGDCFLHTIPAERYWVRPSNGRLHSSAGGA